MQIFKEFEHRADIGIEVYGNSLEQLFEHALIGFYSILLGKNGFSHLPDSTEIRQLKLEDTSPETLLVSFLNELNYLFLVKRIILYPVKKLKIENNGHSSFTLSLRAKEINRISEKLFENALEIKAVTYHQLQIVEKNGQFAARLIFDI